MNDATPVRIKLWDLPTRLFHWLLAGLVVGAVITGKIGGNAIVWHGRIGLAILALLAFRLVWGFVGPTPSRFGSFFPTPAAITAYLRGHWRGIGHNPLGALSVLALLAFLCIQVGTGLFANDDIAFRGPLHELLSKESSDTLTGYHRLAINVLIALIVLHIVAIAFYAHAKKENLLRPMIDGWKTVEPANAPAPIRGGGSIALIVAVSVAGAALYAGSGLWIKPAEPPPAAETPQAQTPSW